MKANTVIKHAMLKYPTLFDCRMDVLIHMFSCIGNGYEWKKGELVSISHDDNAPDFEQKVAVMKMNYTDVNEDITKHTAEIEKYKNQPGMVGLHRAWLLEAEFKKIKRKFIENNIDEMSSNSRVLLTEEYKVYLGHYMEQPCYDYAHIFHIPKDIKEDWGDAAYEFAQFWMQRVASRNQGFYLSQERRGIKSKKDCWSKECHQDWVLFNRLKKILNEIDTNLGRETYDQRNKRTSRIIRDLDKPKKQKKLK